MMPVQSHSYGEVEPFNLLLNSCVGPLFILGCYVARTGSREKQMKRRESIAGLLLAAAPAPKRRIARSA